MAVLAFQTQSYVVRVAPVAKWMKQPAVMREIRAHSNPILAEFGRPKDLAALTAETGGQPWFWTREGAAWQSSLFVES